MIFCGITCLNAIKFSIFILLNLMEHFFFTLKSYPYQAAVYLFQYFHYEKFVFLL